MFILFLIFAALAVWTSVMMITLRNPVHSAAMLVLTFCSLAAIFFLLGAPFLGVLQIIVYAGAIMVLFLFVIMLLASERREMEEADPLPGVRLMGYLFSGAFVLILSWVFATSRARGEAGGIPMDRIVANNTQEVGIQIFTTYLLPFELTSVMLLAAMIGAIVLAKRRIHE